MAIRLIYLASILASLVPRTFAQSCPAFTPSIPVLGPLADSEAITAAAANLTAAFDQFLTSGVFPLDGNAFSIEFWSVADNGPLFTYHWTAPDLQNNTEGVTSVDSDTLYRVASITKVFTVYTFLVNAGIQVWNDPITQYVPELAQAANATENASDVDVIRWDQVTIGSLASHLAGVSREVWGASRSEEQMVAFGFPPTPALNGSYYEAIPGLFFPADRQAFFNNILVRHPIVSPNHAPVYSNLAFQLLAYALENITSSPFEDLVSEALAEISLNSTTYTVPENFDTGIIPIDANTSWYGVDSGPYKPGGAIYSTINDLRTFGISILNSSVLTKAQTEWWLKPTTFVPDTYTIIGAPWEIVPYPPTSRFPTRLYTKSGGVGLYSSRWGLVPDYNVGFTILGAGVASSVAVVVISDLVTEIFIPAVQAAAAEQAATLMAGTYSDPSGALQATVILDTNNSTNGSVLTLDSLVYNGTDLLGLVGLYLGVNTSQVIVTANLYPTGLVAQGAGPNGTDLASWRVSFAYALVDSTSDPVSQLLASFAGPFSQQCGGWGNVDGLTYGPTALDEVLFSVDPDTGEALGFEVRFLQSGLLGKAVDADNAKARRAKRSEMVLIDESLVMTKVCRSHRMLKNGMDLATEIELSLNL
ncbi:hypothetical protein PV10_02839 [Exophiala mesophila]|uniref:Uncharacterized protein n=1 Tax=Exophiala mesophila TaxID=212818 RepID=A0A0D1ZKK1_EXOME|nr:uncharacterized protein PV10_02839 [Exophiala mesophila]KIV95157.1 hypothetical protein PV10_02839 [Exophiala mesophila]